ncbi:Ribosome maturation factor RimM [Blochmannia endosymbiont of Polyrhachis (Hedomyrma) turneri]|nr:Ribosome maturation factor RimM [Blochmannia endosymbiont of Polyrhachis (Hedomyrma) turneri]
MSIDKKKLNALFSSDIPINFDPIIIGQIRSAYGIFGWLKIISFSEKFNQIMSYKPWFVQLFLCWYSVYVEYWKNHGSDCQFIVKIKQVSNREMAQIFNNHKIYIDVSQLPLLSCGEYYWKNIIKCQVISVSGYNFGVVTDLISTGSNDVLVVKTQRVSISSRVVLIPFLTTVVKYVDFLNRVIYVKWSIEF